MLWALKLVQGTQPELFYCVSAFSPPAFIVLLKHIYMREPWAKTSALFHYKHGKLHLSSIVSHPHWGTMAHSEWPRNKWPSRLDSLQGWFKGGSATSPEFVWKTGREELFLHHGLRVVFLFLSRFRWGTSAAGLQGRYPSACLLACWDTGGNDTVLYSQLRWDREETEIRRGWRWTVSFFSFNDANNGVNTIPQF